MQRKEGRQPAKALRLQPGHVSLEAVVHNPRLRNWLRV